MASNDTLAADSMTGDEALNKSFFWDTEMSVTYEFVLMLVVLKVIYMVVDYIYALSNGHWYKLGANWLVRHLYKSRLPFEQVLNFDGVSAAVVEKRKKALAELSAQLKRFDYGEENELHSSDTKLAPTCGMYIPYIFSAVSEKYKMWVPHMWKNYDEHTGYKLVDVKGNVCHDLASGNGANIIGNLKINEILKSPKVASVPCFGSGLSTEATKEAINGLLALYRSPRRPFDCVSFNESGSAAVDACVKQSRFHHYKFGDVQRRKVVFFKNAYHGWVRNEYIGSFASDTDIVVLDAVSTNSLAYIVSNYLKIAAIFIDPMKVLSVNKVYPRESLTMGARESNMDVARYVRWMKKIEHMCHTYGILLVLDECYSGFRVGPYGATVEYDLAPDMVILSKQLGCGLNTTAVIGTKQTMLRKKRNGLAKVVFTTGTGSTNPQHHRAVAAFVEYAGTEQYRKIHAEKMQQFAGWTKQVNAEFAKHHIPLQLHQYFNTFSLDMRSKSYFNWMYVLKLVAAGLVFTPGGTTKFTLSFDYDEQGLKELKEILVRCALEMVDEEWFYESPTHSKWPIVKQVALHNLWTYAHSFYHTIVEDKEIDIGVSHNHPVNRWTHFWSSAGQIVIPYVLWVYGVKFEAMVTFLLLHILRQSGHFFYEAQLVHDEKVKIGYKNATKRKFAIAIPVAVVIAALCQYFFPFSFISFRKAFVLIGLFSIANRMVDISQCHGLMRSCTWITKILTDPFTDMWDFYDFANPFDKKIDFTIDWDKIQKAKHKEYSLEF